MNRRSIFLNRQLCGIRLLVKRISQPAARILRKVKICYDKGWVHTEALRAGGGDFICVLPTKLHAKSVLALVAFLLEFHFTKILSRHVERKLADYRV